MKRIIFHVDVNSAFLSWEAVERLKNPEETVDLREIPSAVGGDVTKRHGVILAKSTPAKKYKVRTGEPVVDAVRKCPQLVLVPSRHGLYREYSHKFMDILNSYTDLVEQYSIDEAFMDVTEVVGTYESPRALAQLIQEKIWNTLGFTVNIGISNNRLLAKMASDFTKPNKIHTLYPEEIPDKMWPLPIGELFSVGGATEKKLQLLGIKTIGDLAHMDVEILQHHLKKQGKVIWDFANGRDTDLLTHVAPANKGYGNSITISYDVTEPERAKMILLSLTESVCRRLRNDNRKGQVVSVAIKDADFKTKSHQMVLSAPTNITNEVNQCVSQLFDELWQGEPIRLLGVRMNKVIEGETTRQMSLFDNTDYEKLEKMDQAIDSIRQKFGNNAIMRASFLDKEE